MMNWRIACIGWLSLVCGAGAQIFAVGRPFAAHMVLPMEISVPVWGTAPAGAPVAVRFGGQMRQTKADGGGKWRVMLSAMPPSAESRNLEFASGDDRIALEDVLVGKVYLFSGQSNMDFPLERAVGGKEEAARAAEHRLMRLYNLTAAPTDTRVYDAAILARLNPRDHFTGTWEKASEQTAGGISAVAWWTGRALQEKLGVPVGIVENAVGGSGTEAWLPREVLASRADYKALLSDRWLDSDRISGWARGRARQNLGSSLTANHPFRPGFLFESGVRDWEGFPFAAVVWYQGETNAEIHDDAWNGRLIGDLVTGWRAALAVRDLPFYLVQLPRIGGSDPLRRYWPQYRKMQAKVAEDTPNVHLVVTQDLGWDSPDVHPPDKAPVARRIGEAMLDRP